jgi:hypothetical protein
MLGIYAVVPASSAAAAVEAGVRLCAVRAGTLAAVAAPVRRVPRATEASLRRHDALVRAVAARVPAVLPVRFGTVAADRQALAALLRGRAPMLRRGLREVRGRVQMTLRLPVPERRALPARSSGTAYLRARAAEHALPALDPVRRATSSWVRAERVDRTRGMASVYHLVPRSAVAAYLEAVSRGARDTGLRLSVSGPAPPYAFATPEVVP